MTSFHDAMNHTSLSWVKPELDNTLHQVRAEIEAFAQDPTETAPMQRCTRYLHQVQGTLRMLELYATAMVTEELEHLSQSLSTGEIAFSNQACDILMRGTVLLPDYLERLQSGHRDIPIVLLPVLNEIRAIRGLQPLNESVLIAIDPSAVNASPEEIEHARNSLSGHNRELLDTVAVVVKEELLRIKDALDLHLRAGAEVERIQPQIAELTSVAETLGMMGLPSARAVVLEQRDALQHVVDTNGQIDETLLLNVVGALLSVDSSLDDQVASLGGKKHSQDGLLNTAESQQTVDALSNEAIVNFSHAREHFIAFIETNWDHERLNEVPGLFDEVIGALHILELSLPAEYLRGVREFVQFEIINRRLIPNERELDLLAAAMASLEYYLEALRERNPGRDNILEITKQNLEDLGYWPLPGQDPHHTSTPEKDAEPLQVSQHTTAPVHNDNTEDSTEPMHSTDAALHSHAPDSHPQTSQTPTSATQQEPVVQQVQIDAGFDPSAADIDDDIRDVFLEEFEEELTNLATLMPKWTADPTKLDNARPIRRVFHTLKGSGRLVGARTLGEFAWKIENMLNRVLEGARPPSEAVVAMVKTACDVLPQIQSALLGKPNVTANFPAIERVIDSVTLGEEVFYTPSEHPEISAQSVAQHQPTSSVADETPAKPHAPSPTQEELRPPVIEGTPVHIDSVLREILEAEVRTHLETIEQWLRNAPRNATATEPLLRALHTMNGAFAMADVPEITSITHPSELYVKRSLASNTPLSAEGIHVLTQVKAAVVQTVDALGSPEPRIPSYASIAQQIQTLVHSLPDAPWPLQHLDHDDEEDEDISAQQTPDTHLEQPSQFEHHASEPSFEQKDSLHATTDIPFDVDAAIESALHQQPNAPTTETQKDPDRDLHSSTQKTSEPVSISPPESETRTAHAEQKTHSSAPLDEKMAGIQRVVQAATSAIAPELIKPVEDLGALSTENYDIDLVDIFVEEGRDLLDQCDRFLDRLRNNREDSSAIADLQRSLHTLKGGARMAGINPIGDLGHNIESLFESVMDKSTSLCPADIRLLELGFDRLHSLLVQTGKHRAVPNPSSLIALFQQRTSAHPEQAMAAVAQQPTREAPFAPAPSAPAVSESKQQSQPTAEESADTPAAAAVPASSRATPQFQEAEPQASQAPKVAAQGGGALSSPIPERTQLQQDETPLGRPAQEQVRVRAELLDRLVNSAGEVAIYRSRLEQQLGAFRSAMSELDRTNARLRDQLRRLDLETEAQIVARYQREQDQPARDFDPLELDRFSTLQQLSRALNESAADLSGLQSVLDDLSRQYDTLLQQQSRVSSELQEGLMQARMVPFDTVVPRLRRVIRQACTDTGKLAQLALDGTYSEMDRHVLDCMIAPLEHMLRNSLAHGIELPDQREKVGKAREGTVTIRLRNEGSEVALFISDDGAGLDRAAIRRRAEERGQIARGAALTDTQIDELIFTPGLSTTNTVNQLAGRGVGMDVVRNEVSQIGGTLEINSRFGQGTTFVLRLPQALAVTQAVFVRVHDAVYAVPVASVRGIGRITRERFFERNSKYRYAGDEYTLYDLGVLVGQSPTTAENQQKIPLLLVRVGDLSAAVAIDEVLGSLEVVVKPAGLQVSSIPGIYGATLTGDGRVIIILDVAPLVRRHLAQPEGQAVVAPVQQHRVPLVMVVDDSLTMRKVTTRVLERNNFEVVTARDGVEALELLAERVPDLMLLDIEMPRMDGYELATQMRADDRYKNTPIVMITSRSGDKHRQRAMEIGVERYLGKPYQEPDLMRNVYDLLGIARAR